MKEVKTMADCLMNDDLFPATQPVAPLLLRDVVAYVEVRFGHDNRSRGIECELRTLGAKVVSQLSNEVTHVIFQGGHVSTYKKARQHMCHVVSVSWIEASKELGYRAPEDEHPPPGIEKYEDPDAVRKIKVLKSMQPDFDEEKERERLNAILLKIKRKHQKHQDKSKSALSDECRQKKPTLQSKKKSLSGVKQLSSSSDCSTVSSNRNNLFLNDECSKRNETAENEGPLKKRRKKAGETSVSSSHKLANQATIQTVSNITGKMGPPPNTKGSKKNNLSISSVLNAKETGTCPAPKYVPKNRVRLNLSLTQTSASKNSEDIPKSSDFVVPTIKNKQKGLEGSLRPNAVLLSNGGDLGVFPATIPTSMSNENCIKRVKIIRRESKTKGDEEVIERKEHPTSTHLVSSKPAQLRPLSYIENIPREMDVDKHPRKSELDSKFKSPLKEPTPRRRSLRKSVTSANPVNFIPAQLNIEHNHKPVASNKKFKLALTEGNPFVSSILQSLSTKQPPKLYPKSPWRQIHKPALQNSNMCQKRQSPRLHPSKQDLQEDRKTSFSTNDSGSDDSVCANYGSPPKKSVPPPKTKLVIDRASAHIFRLLKAKTRLSDSPDIDAFDSNSQDTRLMDKNLIQLDPIVNTERKDPFQLNKPRNLLKQSTGSRAESGESVAPPSACEQFSCNDDNDRSESPILGISARRPAFKSLLSNPCRVTSNAPKLFSCQISSHESEKIPKKPVCSNKRADTVDENAAQRKSEENLSSDVLENGNLSTNDSRSSCSFSIMNEGISSSRRSGRSKSRTSVQSLQSTLVCTHMKSGEVKEVEKAVELLGKFQFENQVSSRTSHLVASGPRRTINMLRAISRGCWILKAEWVFESVKAGNWLNESDFELTEFSPVVQQRRLQRQSSGDAVQSDLFSSVGSIFVSASCQPSAAELKELILLNGGSVAASMKVAALVVAPPVKKPSKTNKNEAPRVLPVWVLECIMHGELLSTSSPQYSSGDITLREGVLATQN